MSSERFAGSNVPNGGSEPGSSSMSAIFGAAAPMRAAAFGSGADGTKATADERNASAMIRLFICWQHAPRGHRVDRQVGRGRSVGCVNFFPAANRPTDFHTSEKQRLGVRANFQRWAGRTTTGRLPCRIWWSSLQAK